MVSLLISSIRCVTYNVNDRIPPTGTTELAEVLGYGAEDIIVVGIQEAGGLIYFQAHVQTSAITPCSSPRMTLEQLPGSLRSWAAWVTGRTSLRRYPIADSS